MHGYQNIVLVESNSTIRKNIEGYLKKLGYKPYSFASLKEALSYIENKENNIDICFFSEKLVDGDGIFFAEKLKSTRPLVELVLIAKSRYSKCIGLAQSNGISHFIEGDALIGSNLFLVLESVSEIAHLQKENASLNAQLLHSTKLAVLGEISATVAHDIRGPLSLIQMSCDDLNESLSGGTLQPAALLASLQQMTKACQRIGKLAEHLRHYARDDKNEKQEYKDIMLILEDSTYLVLEKIRKYHINVSVYIDPNFQKASFYCFPNKFEQVLMNLISNACDAMKETIKKELVLAVRFVDNFVYFDVQDTGTGISKEVQEKIFESFFTTKPKDEGTGLGLSIIRTIVKEHAGELLLKSEVGKGSTFSVRFAMDKVSLPKVAEKKASA